MWAENISGDIGVERLGWDSEVGGEVLVLKDDPKITQAYPMPMTCPARVPLHLSPVWGALAADLTHTGCFHPDP